MDVKHISIFKDCYLMQRSDIGRFADTLADGFSQYGLFRYISGKKYDHSSMSRFWAVSVGLNYEDAICIADSKEVNSVLIYIPPRSKVPTPLSFLNAGILRMGLRRFFRLLRFDAEVKDIAKRYKTDDDGYLMAFATRLDRQGRHYGKPLMDALLRYLDVTGQGCYLETLKPENVGLYEHFSFKLKEQKAVKFDNLTMYVMHRPKSKKIKEID